MAELVGDASASWKPGMAFQLLRRMMRGGRARLAVKPLVENL
jgi:hypothetical protein